MQDILDYWIRVCKPELRVLNSSWKSIVRQKNLKSDQKPFWEQFPARISRPPMVYEYEIILVESSDRTKALVWF